jgi:hypothetical protein
MKGAEVADVAGFVKALINGLISLTVVYAA